jgi:hypothetical protein
MSISVATLTDNLGISPKVAGLFVNRRLPPENEYWSKRSGYVSLSTGYIFIPVFFDLLIKKGFDATVVLSEDLLATMENILQSAGRMEYKMIDPVQHVANCRRILEEAGISDTDIRRSEERLVDRSFARIPSKYKALQRANTFLYTFAGRPVDFDDLFTTWELLIPLMLMLDDFTDVEEDHAAREENCLLDSGNIPDNFFELIAISSKLLVDLASLNAPLATYLKGLKDEALARNMLGIMKMGTR